MTTFTTRPPLDRARLARLCEMLRSDNEQERATAARMASNAVASAGLSWSDLILMAGSEQRASSSGSRSREPPRSDQTYAGSWERHEKQRYARWQGIDVATVTEKLFEVRHRLGEWDVRDVKTFEGRKELKGSEWAKLEGIARKAKVWVSLGGDRAKRKSHSKAKSRAGVKPGPRTWGKFR